MKIHTKLAAYDVRALAGPASVNFVRFTTHGSRTHAASYDVILSGSSPYRTQGDPDEYAATWDEWGIFLAALFAADPTARAGEYRNAEHYHWVTGDRFRSRTVSQQHRRHQWEAGRKVVTGAYYVAACSGCGAVRRWMAPGRTFAELST